MCKIQWIKMHGETIKFVYNLLRWSYVDDIQKNKLLCQTFWMVAKSDFLLRRIAVYKVTVPESKLHRTVYESKTDETET